MHRLCGTAPKRERFPHRRSEQARARPLTAHRRRLDLQSTAAPALEQLQVCVFLRARGIGLRAQGLVTPGEHAMRRAERLPELTINWKAIDLPLANGLSV